MDFSFSIATTEDDADIRLLLASNAMPGNIEVTFEREPNYFTGCGTMGHRWQVLVGRHQPSNEIAAVLCRGIQARYVNGQVRPVGYLGQLRVAHAYRGRWVLVHGIKALRKLHEDGETDLYLSAISEENRVARGVLVDRPRPGFPQMHEVARLHTLGIVLHRARLGWRRARSRTDLTIARASSEQASELVSFLRQEGPKRQFFPSYTEKDLSGPLTRGFCLEDMLVARYRSQIVGIVGLWDQTSYKQTVVQSYSKTLRRLRPIYNLLAPFVRAQPLPGTGSHIRSAYASFICIADDDPQVFVALLDRLYQLALARRHAYLMIGLAEHDPLLALAKSYTHIAYHSRLYSVCWPDGQNSQTLLDSRVPYIEIAAL